MASQPNYSDPAVQAKLTEQFRKQRYVQAVQAGYNPETGNKVPEFVPRGKDGKPLPGYDAATGEVDKLGRLGTAASSAPSGVPIIGEQLDKLTTKASAALAAVIQNARGETPTYSKNVQQIQGMRDVGAQVNPKSAVAGNIAGTLATLGPAAMGAGGYALGARAPAFLGRVGGALYRPAASALSGGAIFGADTAARGGNWDEIKASAIENAKYGAAFGLAGEAVPAGLRALFGRTAPRVNPNARQLMQNTSQNLYRQMRSSGVGVAPGTASRFQVGLDRVVQPSSRALAPTAYALRDYGIGRLRAPGQPIDIETLHNYAKMINRSLRGPIAGEDRHYVQQLSEHVHDMLDNLNAADMAGAHPTQAFQQWRQADRLWAQQKKMEIIDNILDVADVNTGQYTQSQLANTIRKEMAALYKKMVRNPGARRGWTAEEIRLVRQMARGGGTGVVVNLLAKFAPRGVISAGAGYAIGGPPLMAAGWLADRFKQNRMTNLAEGLRSTIATRP